MSRASCSLWGWGIWPSAGTEAGWHYVCPSPSLFSLSVTLASLSLPSSRPWAGLGVLVRRTPTRLSGGRGLQMYFRHWEAWVFWFTLAVSVVCFLLHKVCSTGHINLSSSRFIVWNIHWSRLYRTAFGTMYWVQFVLINRLMLMWCDVICLLWSFGGRWGFQ